MFAWVTVVCFLGWVQETSTASGIKGTKGEGQRREVKWAKWHQMSLFPDSLTQWSQRLGKPSLAVFVLLTAAAFMGKGNEPMGPFLLSSYAVSTLCSPLAWVSSPYLSCKAWETLGTKALSRYASLLFTLMASAFSSLLLSSRVSGCSSMGFPRLRVSTLALSSFILCVCSDFKALESREEMMDPRGQVGGVNQLLKWSLSSKCFLVLNEWMIVNTCTGDGVVFPFLLNTNPHITA